jgi:hypothetical protein
MHTYIAASPCLAWSCASFVFVVTKRSLRNEIPPHVGASPYLARASEIGRPARKSDKYDDGQEKNSGI